MELGERGARKYFSADNFFALFEADTFDATTDSKERWQGFVEGALAGEFYYKTKIGWYDDTMI